MTDNLGAIDEDVDFNFAHAEALQQAFTGAAGVLEGQETSRSTIVNHAKDEFRGHFSELFSSNAATAASDATDIATALRNAADYVLELIDQAKEENERRRIAREFKAEQDKLHERWGAAKDGWDKVFGEPEPPVGPPSDPISKSAHTPQNSPRETPTLGGGGYGGGISSAIPENLRAFSTGIEPLDTSVKDKKATLDSAYADFSGSCHYGSLDASGAISALGKWLDANGKDVTWANTLAQAFQDAGSTSGSPVAVADSALSTALQNAGVEATREDLKVVNPSAVGGQPTTGYTLDPVNTGNGNFIEPETDLAFTGGCASLALTRMYNSRGETGGVFGPRWTSVLDIALAFTNEGATWTMHDGRQLSFARSGESFLPCDEENFWLLPVEQAKTVYIPETVEDSATWVVTNNSGAGWFFSNTGAWVATSAGEGTGYYPARSHDGSVSALHHERGHSISFEYVDGKVGVATTSDGRRIEYTYSSEGLLTGAKGNNYCRTYTHNDQGLIEAVADAAGVKEVVNTYDSWGRVVTQKTPHGRTVRFSYLPGRVTVVADENGERSNSWIADTKGRLVGIIDSDDQRQSMAYDRHGNLVSATERDGSVTVHAYDARGRRTRTVTPEGADITYGWDDLDRITDVVTAAGGHIRYTYEGNSRNPSQVHDALGGVTELAWKSGLLRSVTGPTDVSLTFEYTPTGDLLSVTDALGQRSYLVYDATGRPIQAYTPSGALTEFFYDDYGQLTSRKDPDGAVHRFEYDDAGRCIALVDPTGAYTQLRYGVHGEVVETIDPLGRSISRVFDDLGNVASAILPDGATWGFEHDNLSRLVAVTDPADGRWGREYDINGQLIATVDPLGNRVCATVDRQDQRVTLSDVFGSATTTTDVYGRPVKHEGIDGSVELVTYDVAGNPVELVDGEGALTRYEYDVAGKLVAAVFPDATRVEYGYDAAGRPETFTDATGGVTRLVYDADSRVVGKVHPTGEKSTYRYDVCGRLIEAREPGRGVARYGYDAAGRVIFAQDGAFGTRRFAYDAAGQLVRATNGLGGRTHYEYDTRGRVVRITDPAGGVTTRTYTQLDQVDSVTDALGRTTTATYDAAGRQLSQRDATGSVSEWTYDAAGRETSLSVNGRLISTVDRDFTNRTVRFKDYSCGTEVSHELRYDRVGRLLSRTRGGQQMRWVYDAAGKLLSRVDPHGGEHTYVYDAAARLIQVTDHQGGSVAYTYDAASRVLSAQTKDLVSSWVYIDGSVTGHTVTETDGSVVSETHVSRDELGRVLNVEKTNAEGTTESVAYGYDEASQLTAVLSSTVGQAAARYEYDTSGRLVRSVSADGIEQIYTYDATSQLISVTTNTGESTEFIYDGLGRRTRETTTTGMVREFSYGATGYLNSVGLTNHDGQKIASHTITVDPLGEITAIDGGDLFWDTTANVPTLVTAGEHTLGVAPATSWRLARGASDQNPFGIPGTPSTQPGATPNIPNALTGFTLSTDGIPVVAGIELTGARAYDPGTASFLSTDPLPPVIGAAWESNPYSYAGNNPINQVDPWGLRPATDADLAAYNQGHQGALATAGNWAKDTWNKYGGIISGVAVIAAGIALAPFTGGLSIAILGGAALGGGISLVSQGLTKGWSNIDWNELGKETAIGGISNALGFGALKYAKSAGTAIMGIGKNVIGHGDDVLKMGSFFSKAGSVTSNIASSIKTLSTGIGNTVSVAGRVMSAGGGMTSRVGSKVVTAGEKISAQGVRVFGTRLAGYDAVQGSSSNVLGYATDDKDQSVLDYVRHGTMGAITSVGPGMIADPLKKVSVDKFIAQGTGQKALAWTGKAAIDMPGNFAAGYANTMSENNDWNPLSRNNLGDSSVKGAENTVQGIAPLKEGADHLDSINWKLIIRK